MSIETIILRFRDLSTNPGETIKFHQEKIDQYGYTWWGWWNKAGETIPGATFQTLSSTIAKSKPLDIFLFDTGTLTLYPAKLAEIRWDAQFKDIDSPDPNATPKYYQGRKYKAWFKITEFSPASTDSALLRGLTYVDVDEFFETKKSIFKEFDGKQVYSFEELRHQERTIWFVRQFKPDDNQHEILLYDSSRIRPSNFPEATIESHSPRLLWVSDLHFSLNNHAFPLKEEWQKGNRLAEAIRKDLYAQGFKEIGGVLITGDLTWEGSTAEFQLARSFLDDIMSWSTLTPNQIILCPGNHDIRFSDKPWEKGTLIPAAPNDSKSNFEKFYTELFSVVPNEHLASGRRFLLAKSFVIEIASLNSLRLQQTESVFQGHGFVGDDQRIFVAGEMGWRENESGPRPFRIVFLHHHVVPVIPFDLAIYEQQTSVVYDAGAFCNWLTKHRVNLVLHGHMHHTKVVKELRSLGLMPQNTQWHEFTIAALGSTGVNVDHNQLDKKNVYGLLEFSKNTVRIKVREIHARDADAPGDPTLVDVSIPYEPIQAANL